MVRPRGEALKRTGNRSRVFPAMPHGLGQGPCHIRVAVKLPKVTEDMPSSFSPRVDRRPSPGTPGTGLAPKKATPARNICHISLSQMWNADGVAHFRVGRNGQPNRPEALRQRDRVLPKATMKSDWHFHIARIGADVHCKPPDNGVWRAPPVPAQRCGSQIGETRSPVRSAACSPVEDAQSDRNVQDNFFG